MNTTKRRQDPMRIEVLSAEVLHATMKSPDPVSEFPRKGARGFTLIELLVVIAIIAILAALLLPALGKAKFRALVVNDSSNFKQWTVMANMYANDFKEFLPGTAFGTISGAGNPWDVNQNFIPAVAAAGLTVPMWFCPVRVEETSAQYNQAVSVLGHPMVNVNDLNLYLQSLVGATGLIVMNHNLWVARNGGMYGTYPMNQPQFVNTDPNVYGWPKKTTDRGSAHVPFISDACFSGYPGGGTSVDQINITGANNTAGLQAAKKTSGHVYNHALQSVNAAYADGHVELHKKQLLQCVFIGDSNSGWFY